MSASTLRPSRPRNRLQTLATVVTWVFWLAVAVTALQVILALTRSGALLTPVPNSQPGALACLNAAQQLLQHAGSGLSHLGLSPGVRATWTTASVCTVRMIDATPSPMSALRAGV